jgi:hypothetical protein
LKRFTFPSHSFDEAAAAVCHGTATEEQMRALNELLRADPAARDEYIVRLELHSRLASEPDLFAPPVPQILESDAPRARCEAPSPVPSRTLAPKAAAGSRKTRILALAACLALLLGGAAWFLLGDRSGGNHRSVAMLNRVVDARWNPAGPAPRLGAPLEPGVLRLDSGLAQIVFYNGARVVVEGPAELRIVSSGEAALAHGKLTAEVPPQARGFRVETPQMEVVDLGTSFGLDIGPARSEVHVFHGSVEFRPAAAPESDLLLAGRGAVLDEASAVSLVEADPAGFSALFDLHARSLAAEARRYDRWREANRRLKRDPSLWVHFDFEHSSPGDWQMPNTGAKSSTIADATVVGAHWSEGRWSMKPALEFRGVGDRVRLNIPDAAESVTLSAWVRVQGLDRQINSLFMSDGFLAGTLHWTIRKDGVQGLTVIGPKGDHQILVSPPVFTVDQLGLWTHVAVVVDGKSRRATHYMNGQPVSQHPFRIAPPFRLGASELGNWNAVGFPGNDPFLVRNFSGVMDEFCLFGRALSAAEIRALYQDGKPQSDPAAAPDK